MTEDVTPFLRKAKGGLDFTGLDLSTVTVDEWAHLKHFCAQRSAVAAPEPAADDVSRSESPEPGS